MVTVAELLSRNVPAQRVGTDTDGPTSAEFISVPSLLRREGRAPRAADRPLVPRGNRNPAPGDEGQAIGRSTAGRRATIAAGTLVAVGSVLGAAVFTQAASNSSAAQEGLDGSYPGHGLRGGGPNGLLADGGAVPGGLDAGTAAPTSWMPVAFPTQLNTAAAADRPGGDAARSAGPRTGSPTLPSTTPAVVDDRGPSGGSGPLAPAPTGPVGGAVSGVTAAVGGTVESLGDAAPEPVGGPVRQLGSTVTEAGTGLGHTADAAVGTVQKLAEPVTAPVSAIATNVVPAAKPVTDLLAPPAEADGAGATNADGPPEAVSTTLLNGVGGIAEGAGQTVGSLTRGVLG
ncbi:hypothetical protein ACFQE5_00750 [Pseudonocardia hispaniensis]|uniref:GLTT repeat-containing protein n=1 Tax=Pseudonocardia hispaniensis TaxID=904933 RepID=A0ABW1IWF9_9PSEU